MPKFKVGLPELATEKEIWLFLLKHLHTLDEVPEALNKGIFKDVFTMGNVANMSLEEQLAYWSSLKLEWDDYSIRKTAERMGHEQGLEQGVKQGREVGIDEKAEKVAVKLLKAGKLSVHDIADAIEKDIAFVERIKARFDGDEAE